MTTAVMLAAFAAPPAEAQTFPTRDYFRGILVRPESPGQVPGPEGLRDSLAGGKLRLALADTVRLTLANNTGVRLDRLDYESAQHALQRVYQPFEPGFTAGFNTSRSFSPTTSQLDGAATLSNLSQQTSFGYQQAFQTGTRYTVTLTAGKFATNSIFSTFNPSITSNVDFRFTQPLWRNRGLRPNRAPIVIAQRNLRQSRASFEAQVSEAVARAVDQYWAVVQARENLKVLRKSLELAEATYRQNKRALELGALPPLDIYRSESEVASRRVKVIGAEYALKQAEDELRRTIGADLDPMIGALDLDLVESSEPAGELVALDAATAMEQALHKRPELEALRQRLANDDTGIELAHNAMQPDLSLTGFYSSSGRGGNQIDTSQTPPVLLARGGLADAFEQLGGFNFPTYGFNFQLRLPLRNRAAEADLANALVGKRRGLYLLRQTEQAIRLEARNAVHQLEQAKLQMAASRLARDLAQKNLEAEQRKYELGAQTIFFVLEAQNQLVQAEQSLLQAEIGYQKAVTALDRATGALLHRHHIRLSD